MISEAHDTQGQFSGYIVLEVDMNVIYGFISDNTGLGSTGETFLVKKMHETMNFYSSALFYMILRPFSISNTCLQGTVSIKR